MLGVVGGYPPRGPPMAGYGHQNYQGGGGGVYPGNMPPRGYPPQSYGPPGNSMMPYSSYSSGPNSMEGGGQGNMPGAPPHMMQHGQNNQLPMPPSSKAPMPHGPEQVSPAQHPGQRADAARGPHSQMQRDMTSAGGNRGTPNPAQPPQMPPGQQNMYGQYASNQPPRPYGDGSVERPQEFPPYGYQRDGTLSTSQAGPAVGPQGQPLGPQGAPPGPHSQPVGPPSDPHGPPVGPPTGPPGGPLVGPPGGPPTAPPYSRPNMDSPAAPHSQHPPTTVNGMALPSPAPGYPGIQQGHPPPQQGMPNMGPPPPISTQQATPLSTAPSRNQPSPFNDAVESTNANFPLGQKDCQIILTIKFRIKPSCVDNFRCVIFGILCFFFLNISNDVEVESLCYTGDQKTSVTQSVTSPIPTPTSSGFPSRPPSTGSTSSDSLGAIKRKGDDNSDVAPKKAKVEAKVGDNWTLCQ